MRQGLDFEKAEAALKRAADKAVHGTREERSGRFLAKAARETVSVQSRVIMWERHGHSGQSRGFVGEQCVAAIHKHKNHTHTNDGIYSVEVLGKELPKRFRGIKEARLAGETAYKDRQQDTVVGA